MRLKYLRMKGPKGAIYQQVKQKLEKTIAKS